jgi:cytochrome c biogenesis factor
MLAPGLIFVTALALMIFGLQSFLTAYRRKFANEMIKAATLVVMGMFLMYFWSTITAPSVGYNAKPSGY